MTCLRKRVLAVAIVAALSGGPAVGQIPVIDAGNLAQAVAQVQALAQQLTTLQSQLQQLQTMYSEMTGITGHAQMLSNSLQQIHDFLPADIDLSALSGTLAGAVAATRSAREAFSADDLFGEGTQYDSARATYDERGEALYTYLTVAQDTYDALRTRRATLDSLRQAAGTATTQKSALDLNNRIAAENALLANDSAQLQALSIVVALEMENFRHNAAARNIQRLTVPEDVLFPE